MGWTPNPHTPKDVLVSALVATAPPCSFRIPLVPWLPTRCP